MKDFLESLELGDDKYKLSKDEIKSIIAENGKYIKIETEKVENKYKEDIETYKSTIDDLKTQISQAPKTEEMENLKTRIADYEKQETDRVAKENAEKEDRMLTENILSVFGDRKFVNDYTKNSIINDIKTALKDKANIGKSTKDLFDEITKDKEGIFANPNPIKDMPPVDENISSTITKEAFDKMGYNERLELKQNNPELFAKYNE